MAASIDPSPPPERDLITNLRARGLLEGARGGTPADIDAIAAVVSRVSNLAIALSDDLESIEVNPLRVDGPRIEALDALNTWKHG